MRRLPALLVLPLLAGLLPAEDVAVNAGGGIAPSPVPGFVVINASGAPAATHVVRVGAISHLQVPRPDRPGDATVVVVPGSTGDLRFVIPVRVQPPEAVLGALKAAVAAEAPAR